LPVSLEGILFFLLGGHPSHILTKALVLFLELMRNWKGREKKEERKRRTVPHLNLAKTRDRNSANRPSKSKETNHQGANGDESK
jgi:hypothetical protein